ncbi:MAG: hypothetical protein ACLPV2_09830 [Steroidobacteraceae bacterium]
MNAKERQGLIDLRVELGRRVRSCAACRGTGRLPSSGRRCPCCDGARRALESTAPLLLPQSQSEQLSA